MSPPGRSFKDAVRSEHVDGVGTYRVLASTRLCELQHVWVLVFSRPRHDLLRGGASPRFAGAIRSEAGGGASSPLQVITQANRASPVAHDLFSGVRVDPSWTNQPQCMTLGHHEVIESALIRSLSPKPEIEAVARGGASPLSPSGWTERRWTYGASLLGLSGSGAHISMASSNSASPARGNSSSPIWGRSRARRAPQSTSDEENLRHAMSSVRVAKRAELFGPEGTATGSQRPDDGGRRLLRAEPSSSVPMYH
jgi:hypothetical protein